MAAMNDCVTSIVRRRSLASATTPPTMESRMIGTTRTSPTIPSARPFRSGGARSETCQRMAALCIMEPVTDRIWPDQSSV